MSQIIDRRRNGRHKSAVNRKRFIERYKSHIKQKVQDAVSERSITNIDQSGETISIPDKDINEPHFRYGQGGVFEQVLPGNKEFSSGDEIRRPPKNGGGTGSEASDSGEGEDGFAFTLSREEFLDLFFEDLELPNLVEKELKSIETFKMRRAGFTQTGVPTNINVVRSYKQAMARRIALGSKKKRHLKELEEQYKQVVAEYGDKSDAARELKAHILKLKNKLNTIPFLDPIDLRYNLRVKEPVPSSKAVMFCIMDVSGSMDEKKKEIAKRFFIMLYMFLSRSYDNVELVFVRHHTSAKEVDEQEFFYSRETGGTVVSSALELTKMIIESRYPPDQWNIYCAQASDGDNWNNDSPKCYDVLRQSILPLVQYFAYVEILPRHHQSLWESYAELADGFKNFSMQSIEAQNQIYPVFRELFKKKESVS